MDLSKLSIEYMEGFERSVREDGYTQTDKILPYLSIVYPKTGYYDIKIEDEPLSNLPNGAGCFIVAPQVRHTIVHRISPGEDTMVPRWLFLTVLYNNFLDVTAWFHPPLLVTGEKAVPFISAIDELLTPALPHAETFRKMRMAGSVLENLLSIGEFRPEELQMEQISPAVDLIRKQFDRHLSVEDMARACGMSVSAFYRAFRRTLQTTPMQHLNDFRLKQAAQMLMQEKRTLSDIAAQCGFFDEFHLSRNFKAGYGVSPREYKKRITL